MATARDEAQWDRAASIMAAVIVAASDKPCDPLSMHPHYKPIGGRAGGDTEIAAKDLPPGAVFGLLKKTFVD